MSRRKLPWARLMGLTIVAALIAAEAQAHKAPSGWEYPKNCCNDGDCKPVPCDELVEMPSGSIIWKKEGWTFQKGRVFASGDDECHVCISCVFLRNTV